MTVPAAPLSRPALVGQVELAEPLPDVVTPSWVDGSAPPIAAHPGAWLLIRLHGAPLGVLELPLTGGQVDGASLERAIDEALGSAVAAHLTLDGIPDRAGADRWPRPWLDAPCRTTLRTALRDGPHVSVVVPCADRPTALRRCLDDLRAQSYPRTRIIVVDNAPGRSGADRVVAGLPPDGHPVDLVTESRPGTSHARNRGLRHAATAVTAFVDADVRVDRDWVTALAAPFHEDPAVAATTGLILPLELETPAQRWLEAWGGFGKGLRPLLFDLDAHRAPGPLYPYSVAFGSGTSMAFSTEVLRALGGFDPALGARTPSMGGEDIAAMLDVVMAGGRLAYRPDAIVWHPHPREADDLLAKLESYGVGLTAHLTRVASRHPGAAVDIARRMPAALRYFFAPSSARNRSHGQGYPAAAIRRAELRGMARGALAYARSPRVRPVPLHPS